MNAYRVVTHYRDGDTWDHGAWEALDEAITVAEMAAVAGNEEITAYVIVTDNETGDQLFKTDRIGEQ